MKMTSRERVLRQINGQSVDRVPVEFGGFISGIVEGTKNSIAEGPPYGVRALYEYCGIKDYAEPAIAPSLSCVTNLDERLYERLGSDVWHTFFGGHPFTVSNDGKYLYDMYGLVLQADGFYYSFPDSLTPLHDADSIDEVKNYNKWPDPTDPIFLSNVIESVTNYHENTDKAVSLFPGYPALIFHMYAWLRGFDKFLTDMYVNKKLYCYLADKITDIALEICRQVLPKVGAKADMILYGDDMGMQTQALMSVEDYRAMVKPWSKRWVTEIKNILPNVKVQYHTCGSIFALIPDMIDCGFDIINPIQPLATNMEAWRLKKEFGNRVTLHGGIDIQRLVPFGTVSEIKHYVKTQLSLMEGSRYILACSHNIEPETPPENIVAVFDAVREYYGD
ncbi:MAG: uroporphyrinogen decarboxylase family protein [Synergistaceae bacterium]|jgi:uroporphyrinogen decarboxylase|nr:uroporphyrinogen decarboxylase family protein [Synergistaceae bacterium]